MLLYLNSTECGMGASLQHRFDSKLIKSFSLAKPSLSTRQYFVTGNAMLWILYATFFIVLKRLYLLDMYEEALAAHDKTTLLATVTMTPPSCSFILRRTAAISRMETSSSAFDGPYYGNIDRTLTTVWLSCGVA